MCNTLTRFSHQTYLFIVSGIFTLVYWVVIVPLFYTLFHNSPKRGDWIEHWDIVYFTLAFLLWALVMFVIIGLWYLLKNQQNGDNESQLSILRDKEDYNSLGDVSKKARFTLGIEDKKEITEKKTGVIDKEEYKKKVENLKVTEIADITPLPEYSPEVKSTIFFSDEEEQEKEEIRRTERERSRSPYRDYLHIVPMSPVSPEKSFEDDIFAELNGGKKTVEVADGSSDRGTKDYENVRENNGLKELHGSEKVKDVPEIPKRKISKIQQVLERGLVFTGKVGEKKEPELSVQEDNTETVKGVVPETKLFEVCENTDVPDENPKNKNEVEENVSMATDVPEENPTKKHGSRSENSPEDVSEATDVPEEAPIKGICSKSENEAEDNVAAVAHGGSSSASITPRKSLLRGESKMHLGEVECKEPEFTEVLAEVSEGVVVSLVQTGQSHVLTTPLDCDINGFSTK